MRSRIFSTDAYQKISDAITVFINNQVDILSAATSQSPRATGDALQVILSSEFPLFIKEWCATYSTAFARRAMADLAFSDKDDRILRLKSIREFWLAKSDE